MPSATSLALASQKSLVLKRNRNGVDHRYRCRICKEVHPLRRCERFARMSVDERMRAVILHKYCENCLAHDHYGRGCTSAMRCMSCREKHHSMLHVHRAVKERLGPRSSGSTETRRRRSERKEHRSASSRVAASTSRALSVRPPSVHFKETASRVSETASRVSVPRASATEGRLLPTTSLGSISRSHYATLAPTVMATLMARDRDHVVRGVLDQCDMVSSISRRLVRRYGLPTVSADGQTYCQVSFRSPMGPTPTLRVAMRVDESLSYFSPTIDLGPAIPGHFMGIVLADPDFGKARRVELVFGGDVYQRIILDGVLRSPGLPIAQKSIFGYVVSGACPV